jgi:hypothetical protein
LNRPETDEARGIGPAYQTTPAELQHFRPRCLAAKSWQWLEKQIRSLLPITYYHCIFTLPAELNSLVLLEKARAGRPVKTLVTNVASEYACRIRRSVLNGFVRLLLINRPFSRQGPKLV